MNRIDIAFHAQDRQPDLAALEVRVTYQGGGETNGHFDDAVGFLRRW